MGKFIYILLFSPIVFYAQNKIRPVYSFAVNNGFNQVVSKDRAIETNNVRSLGFNIGIGLQKIIDSTYVIYVGLRYDKENGNFEVKRNGVLLPDLYYFTGKTFTLLFAPGLMINKRQKLFLTAGIARIYPFTGGGSGGGTNRRSYIYGQDLSQSNFDFRLGLKWQIKPFLEKRLHFEWGAEITFTQHHGRIEVENYNYHSSDFYYINYNTLLLYFGIQF